MRSETASNINSNNKERMMTHIRRLAIVLLAALAIGVSFLVGKNQGRDECRHEIEELKRDVALEVAGDRVLGLALDELPTRQGVEIVRLGDFIRRDGDIIMLFDDKAKCGACYVDMFGYWYEGQSNLEIGNEPLYIGAFEGEESLIKVMEISASYAPKRKSVTIEKEHVPEPLLQLLGSREIHGVMLCVDSSGRIGDFMVEQFADDIEESRRRFLASCATKGVVADASR